MNDMIAINFTEAQAEILKNVLEIYYRDTKEEFSLNDFNSEKAKNTLKQLEELRNTVSEQIRSH